MNKRRTIRKPLKVIHSTAPIRINDIGGWTDTWFSGEGKVLNFAVSPLVEVKVKMYENKEGKEKRVFVHAKNFGDKFVVNPEKPNFERSPHIQGCLGSLPIPKDFMLDIVINSRVPPGSSTGTSASVCVALLGGLSYLTPKRYSLDEIISLAHRVETEKLKLQSGIQDQICAAHGGICFIHMYRYPKADVLNLKLERSIIKELDRRLCLIYLGMSHSSSVLHEEVIAYLEKEGAQFKMIRKLRELAEQAKGYLLKGDLDFFGEIMIKNNECQRSLHPDLISKEAGTVIQIAKKYKAAGWKVNGAGGKGGSLTVLGSQDKERKLRMLQEINSLKKGIKSIPISLSLSGLKVREEVREEVNRS